MLDNNKIEEIWGKATEVPGYDSSRWRKDFAGAWMQREQYGLPTEFGWEIFHLIPASKGGRMTLIIYSQSTGRTISAVLTIIQCSIRPLQPLVIRMLTKTRYGESSNKDTSDTAGL